MQIFPAASEEQKIPAAWRTPSFKMTVTAEPEAIVRLWLQDLYPSVGGEHGFAGAPPIPGDFPFGRVRLALLDLCTTRYWRVFRDF